MTIDQIVNKSILELKTLNTALANGNITLKEFIEKEEQIGKKYSRWAEQQDKALTKAFWGHKKEFSMGLNPNILLEVSDGNRRKNVQYE